MSSICNKVVNSLAAGLLLFGCSTPTGDDSGDSSGPDGAPFSLNLGEEQSVSASDGENDDEFGWSVATFGEVVIAGAPGVDDVGATNRGGTYFYERQSDGTWLPADSKVGDQGSDQFGYSIDVDGDYAVIGAPRPGQSTGLEYIKIFGRQGDGSWSQIEKPIDETATRDDFGHSVGISGLRVLAGAPKTDLPTANGTLTDAGAAHVIDDLGLPQPSWPEGPTHTLRASDAAANDWFGYAVAIEGEIAVVGAPGQGGHANKAYVFERQIDGTWEEHQILSPSSPQSAGGFGWSVAIDEDIIAVGAPYEDSAFGAAYLYEQEPDGSWTYAGRVVASDRSEDASFGIRVSLNNGVLLVGAEFGGGATSAYGRAYLFSRSGTGSWEERLSVSPIDAVGGDRYGFGADISEETVVIGAPSRASGAGADSDGEIFVYRR